MHKKIQNISDFFTLAICYFYLSYYFPGEYIFLDTVVTGGDTASHHASVDFLKNYLLPNNKIIGWYPGNYGGFPLFIYYFPFLFFLAALIGNFIPLTIALKIITIIGPLLLPICTYLMLRICKFSFPGPALGTIGSILFLVNSSNSMWGGNIYSTFAGEFSYEFSFALTFLFLAVLFRLFCLEESTNNKQLTIVAIILIWTIGLTHGFTLIICALSSLYFLLTKKNFTRNIATLFIIFGIGSSLFAFWFLPLFLNLPYTTQFEISWNFQSWKEYAPIILLPTAFLFILYSLTSLLPQKSKIQILSIEERKALLFIWFICLCCGAAYFLSRNGYLKLPDIRFIPFVQYLTATWGAAFIAKLFPKNKFNALLPLLILEGSLHWIDKNPSDAIYWAKWNYQGYENAPAWGIFKETNNFLKGSFSDPRVVFEHHENNNSFGSTRAFENLPYFAKRSTLEGLYFQSSLLSPFVFYLQSLYSYMYSCPFPNYQCSSLNLNRAYDYLKLFNVNQIIAYTNQVKEELNSLPEKYTKQTNILNSSYEIWQLKEQSSYVEVINSDLEFIQANNFRETFYQWMKSYTKDSKFLYTKPQAFSFFYGLNKLPEKINKTKADIDISKCSTKEKIENERIIFKTNCPNIPHLIKFAYNPGWKAEGAIGPYLISPAFMMVIPTQEEVILSYDNSFIENIGLLISFIGSTLLLGYIFKKTT